MIFILSLCVLLTIVVSFAIYYGCNKGLDNKTLFFQVREFFVGSVLVWLPIIIMGVNPFQAGIIVAWMVGVSWMLTYPLLFHLTNRKSSLDYVNFSEIICGFYFFGWLSVLYLIGFGFIVAIVEWGLLMICFAQVVYFFLYGTCVDVNGMKILQDSHPNEIIEFAKSYKWWRTLCVILISFTLFGVLLIFNKEFSAHKMIPFLWNEAPYKVVVLGIAILGFGWYIFSIYHGMFIRSGVVVLWFDVKEYSSNNIRYVTETEKRLQNLIVSPIGKPYDKPSTIMMVIGESSSRDYMSAFTKMEHDTTPWMRKMAEDENHTIIFPHAYSCAMHTVQSLEKALTEYNQYNGRRFYDSCSIIDIAHKLGYYVHWYSNQGHLGANETPITLVANTSEVAKWTKQDLGKVQYDQALLDFLDEIDPSKNNFVVLHLKGSHFNYLSRYPREFTLWGEPGVQDYFLNYENSLYYTDTVLEQIYRYAHNNLNLQAMVYFSDHAAIPDDHRSPNFKGFGYTRIPLFVTLSDEYLACHHDRFVALKMNSERYWTNDLLYELMCGIFDVKSNHFDETASLASLSYNYHREHLLTSEGNVRIIDDK